MSCYPNTNLRTQERPTCGPTDPNLYNVQPEVVEEPKAEVVYPEGIEAIDGAFNCVVCQKAIKAKIGIQSHVKSKAHKAAMEANVASTSAIEAALNAPIVPETGEGESTPEVNVDETPETIEGE